MFSSHSLISGMQKSILLDFIGGLSLPFIGRYETGASPDSDVGGVGPI